MTPAEPVISVVPADEATWEDVQAVFGTRGPASRCQCQRYELQRRDTFASTAVEVMSEYRRGRFRRAR